MSAFMCVLVFLLRKNVFMASGLARKNRGSVPMVRMSQGCIEVARLMDSGNGLKHIFVMVGIRMGGGMPINMTMGMRVRVRLGDMQVGSCPQNHPNGQTPDENGGQQLQLRLRSFNSPMSRKMQGARR